MSDCYDTAVAVCITAVTAYVNGDLLTASAMLAGHPDGDEMAATFLPMVGSLLETLAESFDDLDLDAATIWPIFAQRWMQHVG